MRTLAAQRDDLRPQCPGGGLLGCQFFFGAGALARYRFQFHLTPYHGFREFSASTRQPFKLHGRGLLIFSDAGVFALDPGQIFVHLRELVAQRRGLA